MEPATRGVLLSAGLATLPSPSDKERGATKGLGLDGYARRNLWRNDLHGKHAHEIRRYNVSLFWCCPTYGYNNTCRFVVLQGVNRKPAGEAKTALFLFSNVNVQTLPATRFKSPNRFDPSAVLPKSV